MPYVLNEIHYQCTKMKQMKMGSDENLPIENLSDKLLEFLFISYVTRKLVSFVKQASGLRFKKNLTSTDRRRNSM